jgi:hypothetical protein
MDVDAQEITEWMKWEAEKAEQLAAWEAERKAEAERRERQEKRDRLESYLRRREKAWTEHTGTTPPSGMRRAWTEEYVSSIVIGEEADLELRRVRAAAEDNIW